MIKELSLLVGCFDSDGNRESSLVDGELVELGDFDKITVTGSDLDNEPVKENIDDTELEFIAVAETEMVCDNDNACIIGDSELLEVSDADALFVIEPDVVEELENVLDAVAVMVDDRE